MKAVKFTLRNLENRDVWKRNFEGLERPLNKAGERNFLVSLELEHARQLEADGWNVKFPKPGEDGEESSFKPFLPVKVAFGNWPARIYFVSPEHPEGILVSEEEAKQLDYAELESIDLIINPSEWENSFGVTGIKAYLQAGRFKLLVDEF